MSHAVLTKQAMLVANFQEKLVELEKRIDAIGGSSSVDFSQETKQGPRGLQGVKGADGKDGKDAVVDIEEIVQAVLKRLESVPSEGCSPQAGKPAWESQRNPT